MARGKDLSTRVKALITERRYEEAVRLCRRILLTHPHEVKIRLLLAMGLMAVRRYDEVRVEMLGMQRSHPELPDVHRLLGESYLRSENLERAKESLEEALRLDPHDEAARELLSEANEDDDAVPTGTIERWFDPQNLRTSIDEEEEEPRKEITSELEDIGDLEMLEEFEELDDVEELADLDELEDMEDVGELAPLEGEATEARAPLMESESPSALAAGGGRPASVAFSPARPLSPKRPPSQVVATQQPLPSRPPRKSGGFKSLGGSKLGGSLGGAKPPGSRPPSQVFSTLGRAPSQVVPTQNPLSGALSSRPIGSSSALGPARPPKRALKPTLLGVGSTPAAAPPPKSNTIPPVSSAPPPSRGFNTMKGMPQASSPIVPPGSLGGSLPPAGNPYGGAPAAPADGGTNDWARAGTETEELDDLPEEATQARQSPLARTAPPRANPSRQFSLPGSPSRRPATLAPVNQRVSHPPVSHPALSDEDELTRAREAGGDFSIEFKHAGSPSPDLGAPPAHLNLSGGGYAQPQPMPLPSGGGVRPRLGQAAGHTGELNQRQVSTGPMSPNASREVAQRPGPKRSRRAAPEPSTGKKRILLYVLGGLLLVALLVTGFWFTRSMIRSHAAEELTAQVRGSLADGRRNKLVEALEFARDQGTADARGQVGLLRAVLLYDHGEGDLADLEQSLERAQGGEGEVTLGIASVYRRLAKGEVNTALEEAEALPTETAFDAEIARVRALAQLERGEVERAVAFAESAAKAQGESIRHLSMLAMLQALGGQGGTDTLRKVAELSGADRHPRARLVSAEVKLETGANIDEAISDATFVIVDLAEVASKVESSRARLVRARAQLQKGDRSQAQEDTRAVLGELPAKSERIMLDLIETQLMVRDPAAAKSVFQRLPSEVHREERRALAQVEIAMAEGDTATAQQALNKAGTSSRARLMRGLVAVGRGDTQAALTDFQAAAEDQTQPQVARRATAELSAIQLRGGNTDNVIARLTPLLDQDATTVAPILAYAHFLKGDTQSAERVIQRAAGSIPGMAMQTRLQLGGASTRARLNEIVVNARRNSQMNAGNSSLKVELARALWWAGDRVAAKAEIESVGDEEKALLLKAHLALDEYDVETAQALRLRASSAAPQELAPLDARILVLKGGGREAVSQIESIPEVHRAPQLLLALAHAHAQAIQVRQARAALAKLSGLDDNNPGAAIIKRLFEENPNRIKAGLAGISTEIERRGLGDAYNALVLVVNGWSQFYAGRDSAARSKAEEAIQLDPKSGRAYHLLFAILDSDLSGAQRLRGANGTAPPGELLAAAIREASGSDVCRLVAIYMRMMGAGGRTRFERDSAENRSDYQDVSRRKDRCR